MKLAYFPKQTALQSETVWQAFLDGCKKNNITPIENSMDADAAVIWSVLWYGRLKLNQQVYNHYRSQGKPVFIIEVGALNRGVTWKIALNHITSFGTYPNTRNLDFNRPKKLNLKLYPTQQNRNSEILIATQHQYSLQWENLPTITQWVDQKIQEIRTYTDRPIIVRPHPRFPIKVMQLKNVSIQHPIKIPNTYDKYDLNNGFHALVNHNSGPSIQSIIQGTPTVCDQSSLAYPVSTPISQIDDPTVPDREEWFIKICHTEWTVEEIRQGLPIQRLLFDICQ